MSVFEDIDRWKIIQFVVATLLGVLLGLVGFARFGQPAWVLVPEARVIVLLGVGGLSGAFITRVFFWKEWEPQQNSWLYVALFCVVIMAIAAARADQITFVEALLIVVLGSVTLVAAANALSLFRLGEAIELESSWGGLGSALGGWRLSSATSLILSAFIFACGAIAVAQVSRNDRSETAAAAASETKNSAPTRPTPGQTAVTPSTKSQSGTGAPASGRPAQESP
jgi:hypothetical protein